MKRLAIFAISLLIAACGGGGSSSSGSSSDSNPTQPNSQITTIQGVAQKGAFRTGSNITFRQLNPDGSLSGRSKSVTLSNDGTFEEALSWKDWTLSTVSGSYFNECNGQVSNTPLTLRSYSKSPEDAANINLMTHFMASRIDFFIQNGMSLSNAWEKAQQDIKDFFKISSSPLALNAYQGSGSDAKDNAALLLFSGAFACHENSIDLEEMSSDFSEDMSFDDEAQTVFENIKTTAEQPNILDSFANNLKNEEVIVDPPSSVDLISMPEWTPPANQAPVAHAGSNQTAMSGNKVQLNAHASTDQDGTILKYQWSLLNAAQVPSFELKNVNTATPSFIAPDISEAVTLRFSLIVIDDDSMPSQASEVSVLVNPIPNQAPIANAGQNQTVASGSTVTLNGSLSGDSDGSITTYQWTQVNGESVVLSATNTATITFTAPTVTTSTTLTFKLNVTDDEGASSTDSLVNIIVLPPATNQLPIAKIKLATQSVTAGSTVTLDATGSYDPDTGDNITQYQWSQTTGTPTISLSDPSTATPSFTAPQVTQTTLFTFRLVVVDNHSASSTPITTSITVQPTISNRAPIAHAGTNQTVTASNTVTLTGIASSDPDQGDNITAYAWTQTAGSPTVTLNGSDTATPNFTAPNVSSSTVLTFSLVVTDSNDANSTPATVAITINPENSIPVANAGAAQTVTAGTTVTLNGSASSDPDQGDNITAYAWTQTAGSPNILLNDENTVSATFTAPAVNSNTVLTFSLVVIDNHNANSNPATVLITIQPKSSAKPVAKAGDDQTVISGDTVSLDGSASDAAHTFTWTQAAGSPTVTLSGSNTMQPSFTAPSITTETTFTFSLTTISNTGTSNPDTVNIIVKPVAASLLINEVSDSKYSNSERWFEIFNNTNQSINLSSYSLRSLAAHTTKSYTAADYTENGVTFQLPNITIPAASYVAIIANHQNRTSNSNNSQIQYLKDENERVPFWLTGNVNLGYLELLRNNQTVDYVAFGTYSINSNINLSGNTLTISPPTTSSAWIGTGVVTTPDNSSNYGRSIARSATHEDTNTVSDWTQRTYSTLAGPNDVTCNADNDGDGIPDCSEQQGSTYAGIDLYALGARTGQKDLFIEVDYMDATRGGVEPDTNKGMIPHQQALNRIKSVMASKGYHVHFDVGDLFDQNTGINPNKMDLGGGNEVPYEAMMQMCDPTIQGSTIHEIKNVHMNPVRRSIFYYMLFAYSQDNADPAQGFIAGCGETPGNDVLITMGKAALDTDTQVNTYNLINKQSSTVMHELGHNLGLKHGGHEDQQYKPNYLSVMNYLYSGFGLPTVGNNEGDRYHHAHNTTCKTDLVNPPTVEPSSFGLDFSDGSSAEIDENNINEAAGFGRSGSTGIDFNCDGQLTTGVSKNLNPGRTGDAGKSRLQDHNDWDNLQLFFAKRFEQDVYPLMITADGKVVDNPINHHLPDPTWNDVQPVTPEPLTPIH